jgi:serine/threonine protein phosphatase PrpC
MSSGSANQGTAPVTSPSWQVFGYSQIGSAHLRLGTINQDCVDWRSGAHGQGFVGAVADGHGAPPYFRSDIGAQLAVQSALECLQRVLERDSYSTELGRSLGIDIENRWNELVRTHLLQNPHSAHEEPAGVRPYGTTLVAAAVSSRWLVTAQLGDGDTYLGFVGQALQRIDASQDLFQGEQTLSLCLPQAAQYFTIQLIDLDWASSQPDFLVLSTDGVGKSFASAAAYERALTQFRELCMNPSNHFEEVSKQIPGWLNEVSQRGSGDDATLLMAMRKVQSDVW